MSPVLLLQLIESIKFVSSFLICSRYNLKLINWSHYMSSLYNFQNLILTMFLVLMNCKGYFDLIVEYKSI